MDPDVNLSPSLFIIESLSPVITDSSTSQLLDLIIKASTINESPCFRTSKSSKSISVGNISCSCPSRITFTLSIVDIFNLSIIFLAFISWTIPIIVFKIIEKIRSHLLIHQLLIPI